jgi:hypothetical protein
MRYKKQIILFCTCLFFLIPSFAERKPNRDDKIYYQLEYIYGHVEILNHPTLGTTPARNVQIVFQRKDCERCFFEISTDENGDYRLRLGEGVYKVIMRDVRGGPAPSYDMLAPDQPRTVTVKKWIDGIKFDIQIQLPDYE